MIKFKTLKTIEDFESLKPGDSIACEFILPTTIGKESFTFKVFPIYQIKNWDKEIILHKKENLYFNYKTYCEGGLTGLASVVLVYSEIDRNLIQQLIKAAEAKTGEKVEMVYVSPSINPLFKDL